MRKLIFFIILALFVSKNYAVNWDAFNISVLSNKNIKDNIVYYLKDNNDRLFSITSYNTIDENNVKDILNIKSTFFGWNIIKIDNIKFTILANQIQAVVRPISLNYKDIDFIPFIGLGFQFSYKEELDYNFRMEKDNILIRISGIYINEQELCKKLWDAYNNPAIYIKKRDPEYFALKLDQLENELENLKKSNYYIQNALIAYNNRKRLISSEIIGKVIEIKKNQPGLSAKDIAEKLSEKNLEISTKEVELIFNIFFNEF